MTSVGPLYNLPELPASSTERGTGLSGPTLQTLGLHHWGEGALGHPAY